MNKKISMDKKIANSKFSPTGKILYFLISAVVILITGIILSCTVGFNWGADFTGSSSFKIYVNNEASFENVAVYDLNDKEDYNAVYEKIDAVLDEYDLKIVSYRTSSINLMTQYNIPDGQAVEVFFQNKATEDDKIEVENQLLRSAIIAEFDYANFENAVTSVDFTPAQSSFNWIIGILAAIVFGVLAAIVYMMFRYHKSAWIVLILQVALDVLLFAGLLSITRLTVNLSVGIAILSAFVLSIMNAFVFYSKTKENIKSGNFEESNNKKIADASVKGVLFKKVLAYAVMVLITIILAIVAVEGVREVALAVLIALVVTFFSSTFFTPAIWSVVYKEKKKS